MILKIKNLFKSFEKIPILTNVSCLIKAGEIIGLSGKNGSGKTTFLSILSGQCGYEQGQIFVGKWDLKKYPVESKRLIGYVPDDGLFFDSLTVWAHLVWLAKVYKISHFEFFGHFLLEEFSLKNLKNSPINRLSKGDKQALGILCALLQQPKLLILDEAEANLDSARRKILEKHIRLLAESGAVILFASHSEEMLANLSTARMEIQSGQLINLPLSVSGKRKDTQALDQEVLELSPLTQELS